METKSNTPEGGILSETAKRRLLLIDIDKREKLTENVTEALIEVQQTIDKEDISDREAMKEVVRIFEKYNIKASVKHDFD